MAKIKVISILAIFIFLISCSTNQVKIENDYKTVVEGLQIQTLNISSKSKNLIVFLHGDSCNADYMQHISKITANKTNAITVLMARPGCSVDGRNSNGWHGEKDHYTEKNINMVEKAILSLKTYYKSNKVYVIGHSGGAATAGIIIGHNPNLLNGVVLIAFPADIESWREYRRGHNSWTNSLSPQDFINSIKTNTQVYIVSGKNDSNTIPKLAHKYTSIAKQKGINVKHLVLQNESHRSIIRSKKVIDIIGDLVAN